MTPSKYRPLKSNNDLLLRNKWISLLNIGQVNKKQCKHNQGGLYVQSYLCLCSYRPEFKYSRFLKICCCFLCVCLFNSVLLWLYVISCVCSYVMMTSWHRMDFCITGHFARGSHSSTVGPLQKASNAELRYRILAWASCWITAEKPVIWDAMTLVWCHCSACTNNVTMQNKNGFKAGHEPKNYVKWKATIPNTITMLLRQCKWSILTSKVSAQIQCKFPKEFLKIYWGPSQ